MIAIIVLFRAVRLFLDKCDQRETLLETKDLMGMTPFLLACRQKDYATIDLLVNTGADHYAVDNVGNSAITTVAIHMKMDEFPLISKVLFYFCFIIKLNLFHLF